MVTLVIDTGGGSELIYEFTRDSISIGASSTNDVVLRAPGVAPHHLTLTRKGESLTFVVQQRQVVLLNGDRRARGLLEIGDKIRIGTAAWRKQKRLNARKESMRSLPNALTFQRAAPKPDPRSWFTTNLSDWLLLDGFFWRFFRQGRTRMW